MFSHRLPPTLAENRLSRALAARRRAGREVIDLTESNPTAVGLDYPAQAILEAVASPALLVYQPTAQGLPAARSAIAGYYRRHRVDVDPAHVVLSASTSEAYAWLFKLLCDPGDEVLSPTPSYPLFEHLAALEGVRLVPYPLRYHGGWFIDPEEVARALSSRTRALLLVSPHNPTGHILTHEEVRGLVRLAQTYDLALIVDEVFADYAFARVGDAHPATLAGEREALTFCLSGLSKPLGLPQLKLGWIVTSGPAPLREEAQARLELIADTFLSVGAPVQHAAPALLPLLDGIAGPLRDRVCQARALLTAALAGTAADLLDGDGGWAAIVRLPATRSDEEWALALLERGLLVHPGYFFELAGASIVVSLIVAPALLRRGVALLLAELGHEDV